MRIRHRNCEPKISPSAFVAPTAVLVGRVSVAERCRVMYGAVLDAEGASIEVGACSIINEHAVLRATNEAHHLPVLLGDHVLVGPHATLLGCEIERCCYIATGVTVLQGAVLRTGAAIGVGALVHAKTVIPEQFFVPPNSIAIGDPVRIYRADDVELSAAIKSVGFSGVAFGVNQEWEDRIRRYEASTEVRSQEFASHFQDEIIEEQYVKTDTPHT
jgi:carbonic anhydrase/acetyltransferase-like protein (isoleucine patch superfamily)